MLTSPQDNGGSAHMSEMATAKHTAPCFPESYPPAAIIVWAYAKPSQVDHWTPHLLASIMSTEPPIDSRIPTLWVCLKLLGSAWKSSRPLRLLCQPSQRPRVFVVSVGAMIDLSFAYRRQTSGVSPESAPPRWRSVHDQHAPEPCLPDCRRSCWGRFSFAVPAPRRVLPPRHHLRHLSSGLRSAWDSWPRRRSEGYSMACETRLWLSALSTSGRAIQL